MNTECIDVFCHCLPPQFCEAVHAMCPGVPYMFQSAESIPVMTDLSARLRVMDQFPGYRQVLSLASPTIESLAPPEKSPELARIGNNAMREMMSQHPDRFAGFIASLPMNNIEAALEETNRAINDLGAAGVQMYSNVNGRPLDDPELAPLFDLMAELDRPIWLHPIRPISFADYATETVSKHDIWWVFGWTYETSAAMARLVYSGLFDRHPDLKVITHHVGGIVALMEGRLSAGLLRNVPEIPSAITETLQTTLREPPVEAFKRFYADTASFGARAPIECGLSFFGHEKLLFASDMPFDPERGPGFIRQNLRAIEEMDLTGVQRRAILSGNALNLLSHAGMETS